MKHTKVFENAKWIECRGGNIAPVFYKEFTAGPGEKAVITICGLGWFELKINGKRVSDDLFVPGASCYSERDLSLLEYPLKDKLSYRTYFMEYDISSYITGGVNTLSVMLGGGYYHQDMRLGEGKVDFGNPKLCFIIRKESGNVISDSSVLSHPGYFRRCNLYYGEFQDYTAVPALPDYSPSAEIETPHTEFYRNIAPADKIISVISDFTKFKSEDGFDYYDIGINTTGRAVLECDRAGEHIVVSYGESLDEREHYGIHFDSEGRYTDEFITDSKQNEYHSLFSWQGFRYIKVSSNAKPVRVEVIHSDCPVTSYFECDNELINWLYSTFVHTQLCNMHSGVPSDCPHRERLGYTGDGQLCCESSMLMLDCKEFYRKWIYDIADCQNTENGHIQHTAPLMGGGGGPCGWGGAVVEVPYRFYKYFGDCELLSDMFPYMVRFLDYINSRRDHGLVSTEEEGGWCLGDWLPPGEIRIPEALVNSCLYVGYIKTVKKIAALLSREDEVARFDDIAADTEKAVYSAYYSFQQRAFCGDINGASSVALSQGIGNERVLGKIIEKYRKLGEFDTGIIATPALIGLLFECGEKDLAFSLLSNTKEVSFDYMRRNGATTLWENWDGCSSQNHPMFGGVTKYLFTEILGIKQRDDSASFNVPVIAPAFVSVLNRAKGHITTPNGIISVEYTVTGDTADVTVTLPEGISGIFEYGDESKKIKGTENFRIKIR